MYAHTNINTEWKQEKSVVEMALKSAFKILGITSDTSEKCTSIACTLQILEGQHCKLSSKCQWVCSPLGGFIQKLTLSYKYLNTCHKH